MNMHPRHFRITLPTLLSLVAGTAAAAPGTLSESPLFLSDAVEPNAILVLDDSGSMDFEVLMPANDGSMWYDATRDSFVGLGPNDTPEKGKINYNLSGGGGGGRWHKFVYLFPNGWDGSSFRPRRTSRSRAARITTRPTTTRRSPTSHG